MIREGSIKAESFHQIKSNHQRFTDMMTNIKRSHNQAINIASSMSINDLCLITVRAEWVIHVEKFKLVKPFLLRQV